MVGLLELVGVSIVYDGPASMSATLSSMLSLVHLIQILRHLVRALAVLVLPWMLRQSVTAVVGNLIEDWLRVILWVEGASCDWHVALFDIGDFISGFGFSLLADCDNLPNDHDRNPGKRETYNGDDCNSIGNCAALAVSDFEETHGRIS